MNRRAQSFINFSMLLLVVSWAGISRGIAGPPATPAPDVPPPKSVFTLPSNPSEGRDPFFPDSNRPYEAVKAALDMSAPVITDLVVKTILVNEHREAFALINDQTFGVGDEGDVVTGTGRRIHIQCLAIDAAKGTVTVQSGETTVTLTYSSTP